MRSLFIQYFNMNVIPFYSVKFHVVALTVLVLLWFVKLLLPGNYKKVILLFNLLFIVISLKKLFIFYMFAVWSLVVLCCWDKWKKKKIALITIVLTLIAFKLAKANLIVSGISFTSFGVSFLCFKVIMLINFKNRDKLNWGAVLLFIQNPFTLLIGPLSSFNEFQMQYDNLGSSLSLQKINNGLSKIFTGIVLKVILIKFFQGRFQHEYSLFNAYLFSIELYVDLLSYSLMAVGYMKLLGFDLPDNFNKPWLARNPQEFWKRFHITLSSFFNQNVFLPLHLMLIKNEFFKKRKLLAQNVALFVTFNVMGLWNGFQWNYILSGFLFSLSSIIYNSFSFYKCKINNRYIKVIFIFLFVNYTIWALYIFGGMK